MKNRGDRRPNFSTETTGRKRITTQKVVEMTASTGNYGRTRVKNIHLSFPC
jgi:vancomycin resistance protein YoaR